MRRLGIHSCCWTAGSIQEDVEKAMEASAECGFRLIELAYLPADRFDLDRLARRAASLDLDITVSLGLPEQCDVSSEDPDAVQRGKALLADVVATVRDLGGTTLGGILYSAHRKYAAQPSVAGRRNAIAAIARTADLADAAGVGRELADAAHHGVGVVQGSLGVAEHTAHRFRHVGRRGGQRVHRTADLLHGARLRRSSRLLLLGRGEDLGGGAAQLHGRLANLMHHPPQAAEHAAESIRELAFSMDVDAQVAFGDRVGGAT
jgi:hypothetical protein